MTQEEKAHLEGSGAIGHSGVAAGERGVAIDGDAQQSPIVTGDRNVVTVIYQGASVAVPSLEALQRHRDALHERLAAEAQRRWGGMAVYIQEEGAALPIEASPYQTGRLGPRESLLQTLHAADRLLVLGEPGSGKTVSLERLAWELCDGIELAVPVVVRLFQYAGTPLGEWVRATLRETGCLRLDNEQALEAFLQEGAARCFFLFDGLNEVAPPYRDRLVDELALHARQVVPGRTRGKQHPVLHFEHADNFPVAYYAGGEAEPKGLPFEAAAVEIEPEPGAWRGAEGAMMVAELHGSGAIAQGPGAVAAGAGGVAVGGSVQGGVIVTGDRNDLSQSWSKGAPRLPARCPHCNASLRPDTVRWLGGTTAQCGYCGSVVQSIL